MQCYLCSTNTNRERDLSENANDTAIEDAYRRAQESDEEWYAMVISDILGVEELENEKKKDACDVAEKILGAREADGNVDFDQELDPYVSETPRKVLLTFQKNNTVSRESQTQSVMGDIFLSGNYEGSHNVDNSSDEHCNDCVWDSSFSFSKINNGASWSANEKIAPERIALLRYVDKGGRRKVLNVKVLLDLGYRLSEIQKLRSIAVEKIVKSGLQRPNEGIPKKWTVIADSPEISVVRKSIKAKRSNSNESARRRTRFRRKRARELTFPDSGMRREFDSRGRKKMRVSKQESIDSFRSTDDENFWMDAETFTSFLRKEAQLRLSILGPSWSDAVKGESRWRLKIYKNWLGLVSAPKRRKPVRDKRSGRGTREPVRDKRSGRGTRAERTQQN